MTANLSLERPGSGAMFDRIAARYDLLNRLLSFGLDQGWRKKLVASAGSLSIGDEVLDLATGTADVAIALARHHPMVRILGVDPSKAMLDVGQRKLVRLGLGLGERIELSVGDAQDLAAADRRFSAVTISFGIRNIPDRAKALREMLRVTKPGGRLGVLELTEPESGPFRALARWHVHTLVPTLGRWLSGDKEYAYLARSIAAFPPPLAFGAMIQEAGWESVRVERLHFGAVHLFTAERPAA